MSAQRTEQNVAVLQLHLVGSRGRSLADKADVSADELDAHLAAAIRVIRGFDGLPCGFAGHLMVALFGAPNPQLDTARSCVDCALAVQDALTRLQSGAIGDCGLDWIVGGAYGAASVGLYGSDDVLFYGAVGVASSECSTIVRAASAPGLYLAESLVLATGSPVDARLSGASAVAGIPVYTRLV